MISTISLRDLMLKPAGPWKDPYFHLSIHCILIVFYCGGRGDRTAAKYLLERSGPSGHFQRHVVLNMQNMALTFINTFEITKLLRLRKHGIIFESMKLTSKVIVRPIALWQPFCIYWICVSEIKSWTTDAPVSLQGQNHNYENKSLRMVTMAKICRRIALASWQRYG